MGLFWCAAPPTRSPALPVGYAPSESKWRSGSKPKTVPAVRRTGGKKTVPAVRRTGGKKTVTSIRRTGGKKTIARR